MDVLIQNILPFLLIISALVALHELGHYAAARFFGIAVKRFSVGMGPALARRTDRRGTEWAISLLPIGGYVLMMEDRTALSENRSVTGVAYNEVPRWARALVLAAGPAANLIVALGLFYGNAVLSPIDITPPVVAEVLDDSPADYAGIRRGDVILAIDGHEVNRFREVSSRIQAGLDRPVALTIDRSGEILAVEVVPARLALTLDNGRVVQFGQIGIKGPEPIIARIGGVQAWDVAVSDLVHGVRSTLDGIGQILVGQRSTDGVTGMIGMAEMTGHVVQGPSGEDWTVKAGRLIGFSALISLNLALLNLFPLPVLDGGQLLFLAAEGALRRDLPAAVKRGAMMAGIAVIACLFLFTTINDARFLL